MLRHLDHPPTPAVLLIALGMLVMLPALMGLPLGTLMFYSLCGGPFVAFLGLAVWLQRTRDLRELALERAERDEHAPAEDELDVERLLTPLMVLEPDPATLASAVERELARLERELDITIPRTEQLAKDIARWAPRARGASEEARSARGMLCAIIASHLERAMGVRPERVARVVALGGQPVSDLRFVLLTRRQRDALRATGRATFTPWASDVALSLLLFPLALVPGAVVARVVEDPQARTLLTALVGVATWMGLRYALRRGQRGLSFGRELG